MSSKYCKIIGLLIVCTTLAQSGQTQASTIEFDSNYDPEHQDGIPVISAKSIASPSAFDWSLDSLSDKDKSQRRSAVSDEDDDNDDEDRDEQKSGSSNHDSYENPAFGESRRAAREGDDIEQFFDKHLGPQDATEPSGDGDVEVPVAPSARSDDFDDQYAAASSPLATIFQSILNAHKKPLIIQTSEEEPSSNQQIASSSVSSASLPSKATAGGLGATTTAFLGATPIAYITPMTAQQSSPYEQQTAQASIHEGSTPSAPDYGQIREIYISRRPSILGRLHGAYSSPNQTPVGPPREVQVGAASGRIPHDYQQDYSRYPTAASYSSYHQQQDGSQADDGPSTVSYGLSFGGQNIDGADEPSEANDATSSDDQSNVDEQPSYANHMHYRSNNMMHNPSSSMQTYLNQHPSNMPVSYMHRGQPLMPQQPSYSGARYHKDPSEYQAYNPGHYSTAKDNGAQTRQQLLAQLDHQIKSNPQYRQTFAASSPSYSHKAGSMRRPGKIVVKQKLAGSDLDTYSSYHSETDPYKSFTSTSRIVDEPERSVGATGQARARAGISSQRPGQNLLVGPLTKSNQDTLSKHHDLLRNSAVNPQANQVNHRVRRDDSDERDAEDAEDDGVWVDDDEDDDNRQQSSDVNETSQEPNEQVDELPAVNKHHLARPHGFELAPNDLMVYHG